MYLRVRLAYLRSTFSSNFSDELILRIIYRVDQATHTEETIPGILVVGDELRKNEGFLLLVLVSLCISIVSSGIICSSRPRFHSLKSLKLLIHPRLQLLA